MQSVLRWIFWKIDGIIALFIRFLYGLIFDISSARILENYIYEFMGRVYTLLAIFMLFKLSISVVNYILNPDQLTDKSKGFSKLIQNVIIVMALVIMTPQLFDWAYKLQCLILNSGVINTIITNEPNSMSSEEVTAACFGGEDQCYSIKQSKKANSYLLTYSLYSTFVYAKDGDDDSIADISDSSANTRYKSFKTCAEAVQTDSTYVEANNCIFNWKTVKRSDNEYLLLASTACLVFTAYVLIVFAIDIAIRSVKLCFLQLIAPVPIISMLDPNSGKSGMFSKWLKECGKTYGLLFLRLAIVYFVSEIISQVLKDGITTASGCSISMLAKIFIVLGALAFAKQLPDFIKSITGIEMGGGLFSLKKRLDNIPLAGKPIQEAGKFVGRSTASLAKMGGRYLGKAISATATAADKHFLGGRGNNLVTKASTKMEASRNRYRQFVAAHPLIQDLTNTTAEIANDAQRTAFSSIGYDPMKKLNDKRKQIDGVQKQLSSILSRANSEMIKHESLQFQDDAGNNVTMKDFKVAKEYLNALRNTDTSNMTQSQLLAHTTEINRLQNSVAKTEKLAEQAYVDAVSNGKITDDVQTTAMIDGVRNSISRSNVSEIRAIDISSGAAIKKSKDSMLDELTKVDREISDKQSLSTPNTKQ